MSNRSETDSPKLVVQHLLVSWTKKSRGGEAATLRSAVPAKYVLPSIGADGKVDVHLLRCTEESGFKVGSQFQQRRFKLPFWLDPVKLDGLGSNLLISLERGMKPYGIPNRHYDLEFEIQLENWCQILLNRRLVDYDTGEWFYEKEVFNIAYVYVPKRELFVECEPIKIIDLQVKLL